MHISDQSGNRGKLTQGTVWQFEHVNEDALSNIRAAKALFALFHEARRQDGKANLKFVSRPIRINGATTINELREQILDADLEVVEKGCSRSLVGVFTGTLVSL